MVGAAVVAVLLAFFVPLPVSETVAARVAVLATAGGYLVLACVVGVVVGVVRNRRTLQWLVVGADPTRDQANHALRLPVDVAVISAVLWLVGAVVVGIVTASLASDSRIALRVVLTIVLGGLVTSLVSYLLAGRVARPVTAMALAAHPDRRRLVLGVTPRLMLSWLLASGVPALGVLLLYADPSNLGGPTPAAVVLLVTTSLVVGGLGMLLAARSVGQPLRQLREMVERVGDGDYDVRVRVDDAGEIGLLQDRVNAMTEGLAERERLADLFGRHVGADVARRALATGVSLGGEERTAAALFVDIAGSTALAVERGPGETVAILNRFFQVVVDAVERHGGFVNKFEGDAALCVFGVPVGLDDAAGSALAAARDIATAVRSAGEVDLGLGVAYGRVVAGQVGATSRLEYTVIGDAVNEAARLTERAKAVPGRVLASGDAVGAASEAERARWDEGETTVLRGRSAATTVFTVAA
ncbi:adenylate/guanylate cyclase domain-containing protein [Jatrophihabitans sp. YIM 134969]